MAEERRQITLKVRKTVMWNLESLSRSQGLSLPFREWIAEVALPTFARLEARRQRRREKQIEKIEGQRDLEAAHEWALLEDTQWELQREAEERKTGGNT